MEKPKIPFPASPHWSMGGEIGQHRGTAEQEILFSCIIEHEKNMGGILCGSKQRGEEVLWLLSSRHVQSCAVLRRKSVTTENIH